MGCGSRAWPHTLNAGIVGSASDAAGAGGCIVAVHTFRAPWVQPRTPRRLQRPLLQRRRRRKYERPRLCRSARREQLADVCLSGRVVQAKPAPAPAPAAKPAPAAAPAEKPAESKPAPAPEKKAEPAKAAPAPAQNGSDADVEKQVDHFLDSLMADACKEL